MPRAVRIEYPGAVYHVLCRGDRREPIFQTSDDRVCFLETLGETCERTGFRVHSYVLMTNHYHLLVETPAGHLVAGMKWFQGTYTQRYNHAHRLVGHLFQGRYKAIPIEAEEPEYFRLVSDYIHLNPARAGCLDREDPDLASYPWSSYPAFVCESWLRLPWLQRERVFHAHGLPDQSARSRMRYRRELALKIAELQNPEERKDAEAAWNVVRHGWYCGGDTFREWLMERVESVVQGRRRASYEEGGLRGHDERAAERLLDEALRRLGVRVEDLWGRRQTDAVKQAVAWWLKRQTVVGDEWICRRLEMGSRMNVHRAVTRYRAAADRESRQWRKLLLCAD